MVLKRKRSASELCSSTSSPTSSSGFSPFGSPPSGIRTINLSTTPNATPLHLHSRTQKRFRDNRPSEAEVHERTMNLLYSAQQQQHNHQMETTVMDQHPEPAMSKQQQSLHRFWNITSAPSSSTSTPCIQQLTATPSNCEDCGAAFAESDGMEVDSYSAEDHACGACGRHVCFSCSVSNLGEQKRCLQCAGRKGWVGIVGWAGPSNTSMTIC